LLLLLLLLLLVVVMLLLLSLAVQQPGVLVPGWWVGAQAELLSPAAGPHQGCDLHNSSMRALLSAC
jgi:hypothetical protein